MESESSQQFCLRWHNHQSSVLGGLPALLDSGRLTDVTLCAGGRSLRAHRIVLSTCSSYFMDIFKDLPTTQQPVVVILGGGWAELCCLVAFMYAGEVTLPRNLLPSLLRLAKALRITGLTDLNGNIPDVPLEPEYDDSFNSKFESTFSIYENMKLSRQNSDSANSADNVSPFEKSFESHSNKKLHINDRSTSESMQDTVYQELEFLKQLSKHCIESEKSLSVREEALEEGEIQGLNQTNIPILSQRKKITKSSKPNKYLNPVLNELELKNRKIDKIVENLKCNQLKTQELNIPQALSTPQAVDRQNKILNIMSKLDVQEKSSDFKKQIVPDAKLSTNSGNVADIFASNNIFMETDSEGIGNEAQSDSISTVKSETESSPEIISDIKFVPLSPGIQPAGMHASSNPKLFATCYVCHKKLSNQYNLRVHLETHQNARHACVACNHVSRSRDALRKHVSYRHPQLNTSHNVGRPCKNAQSAVSLQSSSNTNLFDFTNLPLSDSQLSQSKSISTRASNSNLQTGSVDFPNTANSGLSSSKNSDSKYFNQPNI